MEQDPLKDWPAALDAAEEIFFAGSIPRTASADEILCIALAEKHRRLNRPAPGKDAFQNLDFALVIVPSPVGEQQRSVEQTGVSEAIPQNSQGPVRERRSES